MASVIVWAFLALAEVAIAAPTNPLINTSPCHPDHDRSGLNRQEQSPILLPAVHWDLPKEDLYNLVPQSSPKLYFSAHGISDEKVLHAFAEVDSVMNHDVVVLDHSDFIEKVDCKQNWIDMIFSDTHAYHFAKGTWSTDLNFMLATFTSACGKAVHARSFWQVKGLAYQDTSLTIKASVGEESGIENVLYAARLTWGTWRPESVECSNHAYFDAEGLPAESCHDDKFDENLDSAYDPIPPYRIGSAQETHQDLRRSVIGHRKSSMRRTMTTSLLQTLREIGELIKDILRATTVVNTVAVFTPDAADTDVDIDVSADIPGKIDYDVWNGKAAVVLCENSDDDCAISSKSLSAYAVNCHTKGKLQLEGHAEFDLVEGLTNLTARVTGYLDSQLQLGLVAHSSISAADVFEREIARGSLPPPAGFSIDGIFSLGSYVAMKAKVGIEGDVGGHMLAGAKVKIPTFDAQLDLLGGPQHYKGTMSPNFQPSVQGNISSDATVGFSLPVTIGMKVSIPRLKLEKDVELAEQPGFQASLVEDSVPGCNVAWGFKFTNDIYLNPIDEQTVSVDSTTSNETAKGCLDRPHHLERRKHRQGFHIGGLLSGIKPGLPKLKHPKTSAARSSTKKGGWGGAFKSFMHQTKTSNKHGGAKSTKAGLFQGAKSLWTKYHGSKTSTIDHFTTTPARNHGPYMHPTNGSGQAGAARLPVAMRRGLSGEGPPPQTSLLGGTGMHNSTHQPPRFVTNTTSASSLPISTASMASGPVDDDESANQSVRLHPRYFNHLYGSVSDHRPPASITEANRGLSTTTAVPDFGQLSHAASADQQLLASGYSAGHLPSTTYIGVADASERFALVADSSGNLRPGNPNERDGVKFARSNGVLYGDDRGRVFHYYGDVMAHYNVSRIRLSQPGSAPSVAVSIALAPVKMVDGGDGSRAYAAVGAEGEAFVLLTCNYRGRASKLFLARDAQKGAGVLQSDAVRDTITGGTVTMCDDIVWAAKEVEDGW